MKRLLMAAALAAPSIAMAQPASAQPSSTQPSAVSFVEPKDGATVRSPFAVKLDIVGKEVTKAGADVPNAGHYVLIVNGDPVAKGQVVPADAMHLHWKNGQAEDKVRLPTGTYRLTAQFVNGDRESYGPALSRTVTVIVK
ncbi:DUF4399 domain-containing protein [Massilia sp. METH4]|uniref:DUF4399 domain-containing protein n=1 Tax=Massilia sp. METH4 TaxID=3123041 RepID=UPI0030CF87A6